MFGVQRSERDLWDLVRSVGGLLFATGAVVLLIRKSGHSSWGDLARVAVVFVPAALPYVTALRAPRGDMAEPWQSVFIVAATC